VLGLGQIDAAEVAFVEHRPFGAQPAEVLVAEIVAHPPLVDPDLVGHRVSRARG